VREVKDLSSTRLREGDAVLAAIRTSTKEPVALFSNFGSCYVLRAYDIPASTGYGEPVQKLLNFRDGERVIAAMSMSAEGTKSGTLAIAVSKTGFGLRFNVDPHRELSTRSGRRFAKIGEGDEIVGVEKVRKNDLLAVVTAEGRALCTFADEVAELANPGRGVTVIKVDDGDAVLAFALGSDKNDTILVAETEGGRKIEIGPGHDEVVGRGGKGRAIAKRTKIVRAYPPDGAAGKLLN
jgi:DNA gyrase subunit A